MKWRFQKERISDHVLKFRYVNSDDQELSFREVVELWADVHRDGSLFRAFHCQLLSDIPFEAYKWEGLDRPEDQTAFQNQFDNAEDSAQTIEFPNLGRNAILVVPRPCGQEVNHCHLASFLRTCGAQEESMLWKQAGKSMLARVSDKPVWLSTAGGGVAWLHIRLDDRPKYYGYRDYKSS